jgi:DNA-binding beta-propeller fold protein YncE
MSYTVSSVVNTVTVLKPDGSALPTGASFTQSILSTTGASRVISVIVTFTNAVAPLSVAVFAEANAYGKQSAASATQPLLSQYAAPVSVAGTKVITLSGSTYTHTANYTSASTAGIKVYDAAGTTLLQTVTTPGSGTFTVSATYDASKIGQTAFVLKSAANATGRESVALTVVGENIPPPAIVRAGTVPTVTLSNLHAFGSNGSFPLNNPRGIATDATGNIYVADSGNHRIQKFDSNGNYLSQFGQRGSSYGDFEGPRGIAIDAAGNIYVVDAGNYRIQIFTNAGSHIRTIYGTGGDPQRLLGPRGIAIDAAGNIYVTDPSLEPNRDIIRVFNSTGGYIRSFGPTGSADGYLYGADGIAIDATGNIYVADTTNNRVQKFDSNGNYLAKFGSYGVDNGQFDRPTGIAIDASGKILVADGSNRIQTFTNAGIFVVNSFGSYQAYSPPKLIGIAINASGQILVSDIGDYRVKIIGSVPPAIARAGTLPSGTLGTLSTFGSLGTDNGQLAYPYGVATDAAGNIYVAESDNHRIQKFNSAGTHVSSFGSQGTGNGQFNAPRGIAIGADGNIYVADTDNNRIQMFTSTGTHVSSFGTGGTGNGQFNTPTGIAIDATGNIYVADTNNNRIQMFTSTGTHVSSFGTGGTGNGQFNTPTGIAIDATGNIYVADTGNHRIQMFTSTGTHVSSFGSVGTGNGQFNTPRGIAIDASGKFVVADTMNHRIQLFTSARTHVSSFGSFGTGNGQFNRALGIAINASGKILVVDQNNHRVQIVVIAEFDLGGGAIVDGAYLIPMPNGAKNSYGTTWDEPGGNVFVYSANNYNTGSHVIGANIAMSADGTQMVVGSPFFDGSSYVASSNYGIIQILGFNSSGTSWTLNGSDSGGANNYKLGEQVAISGDGKVVAATVNVGVGQIKLYKNGSNYATLSGATYSVFSGFGMALSLSGNGRWLALSGNSVTTQNTNYLPGYIKVINISDGTYSQWGQDILGPDSTNAVLGSQLIISADGKKLIASTGNYSYGGNSNYNKIVVYAKPSTTSGSWNNIWVKENYDIILGRQRDLSASYDLNIIAFARRISASPHTPTTYIYNTETNTLINSIVRSYSLHNIGEFDLAISGDGKVIAQFETTNSTQYNVYVYDIATLAQIGNTISRTATMGYNCISLSGAGTKIGISIPYGTPANPGGEVSVFHIPRTEYVEYTSSNATFTPVGKTSLIPWEWTTTSGGSATITATQYINGAVNKTWTDTFTVS